MTVPATAPVEVEAPTVRCAEAREALRSWPAASVDHVITDPPYEAEAHVRTRRIKRAGGRVEHEPLPFPPLTEEVREGAAAEFARVARRWVLVFCQVEAAHKWRAALEAAGLRYKRTGVWVKPDGQPQISGDRPGVGFEAFVLAHAPGRTRWNGGGRKAVYTANRKPPGGRAAFHPTEKPQVLMGRLLADLTDRGELVLDPFAGSGSTGVAAVELGRRFVGYDLDPGAVAVANDRLRAAAAQVSLFPEATP